MSFQVGVFQPAFQQVGATPPPQRIVLVGAGGPSWEDEVRKRNAKTLEVRRAKTELRKVEKKIANAEKRVAVHKTEGILANLHRLEVKRMQIEDKIYRLELELQFPDFDDDEENIEILLLDS